MTSAIEPQETKREVTAIERVSSYLDKTRERFASVVGDNNAGAYISSVMIAVKQSEALQRCSMESIYVSALRAATLRLSVDSSTGQAYIVPFKGQATLVVGYKGLYDMAVRTGRYRYINVSNIYEGQIIEENQITGFHTISGARSGNKTIGWLGAFEMNPSRGQMTGFGKTFYMTVEQIHEHAKEYSKSYTDPKSAWVKEPDKMERKTVLRLMIRRWGYLDPADVQALEQIENEQPFEAESSDIYDIPDTDPEAEKIHKSTEENLRELGF